MSSLYLELQPDRVHSARQIPFSVLLLYRWFDTWRYTCDFFVYIMICDMSEFVYENKGLEVHIC